MSGLKINICFWYVDETLIEEIIRLLNQGSYEPAYIICRDIENLRERFSSGEIDLIIADFDLPDTLRSAIEGFHNKIAFHVPLIYIVGEKNEQKAAESLTRGVWDYILKSQFIKLIPTVYSSQKYGKVIRHSIEMEDELKASELRYRTIFNAVKDGMLLIERDSLKIIDFNRSIRQLFNLEYHLQEKDVITKLSALLSNYLKKDLKKILRRIPLENSVSFLSLFIKAGGEEFWSECTLSQLEMDVDSNYILVIRDFQEQKLMEESLRESREHFKNLAENSPDVIMRFDRQYKHIYVNSTVEEQVGIPVEQFLFKSHEEMDIFPEHMVEFWEEALKVVFDTSQKHTVEFDLGSDKGILSFEWRLFPEFDEDGKIQTVLAIARNITESKLAREAIRKSEERLNLALEATSLGYWDWNVQTNEVILSRIYMQMLGYEEFGLPHTRETWMDLMHPEDRDQAWQTVNQVLETRGKSFEMEFRMLCKDGSYKWICGRGRAVEKREDGAIIRLVGTHEDISKRKRNDEIQTTLFNISNAVNTTKNLDELYEKIREHLGRIIDTTNCFLALYHEESNMLTLPFLRDEVDSFTEFPAGKTLTGYVVSTGKAQLIDAEKEKELTDKGLIEPVGSPCVSWLGVPLKTDDKITGVFAVQSYNDEIVYTAEDVSILEFVSDQIALAIERKRDQDNIRESQAKQRRIFESSPDPIIVVDKDGIVKDYNTNLLNALNVTNETVIGQNVFHFLHKKNWREAISNFRRTWEEGYIKNLEFVVRRADGTIFESEVSTGAIYNNLGDPEFMVIIFKDITERKETERSLREAKERAEESDKLKTAFLSNMSHEIRTPMNAIVGFSDLLNDVNLGEEERAEFIAQINLGADNLMHLIDDIIDISKIEAGQIKVNKVNFNLNAVVREQIVMFTQNLERQGKSNIDLRLDWKLEGDHLVINSDPFRVKQIISNLVNNAIKFTEEGYIIIGVEKQASRIRITVRDSGIGIETEKQEIIFDRFMQGHQSKNRLYGGTGLGLAISKNLAEFLGGEIGVESEPGKGSDFWFTLPLEDGLDNNPPPAGPSEKLSSDWKGKKILVAEDDPSNYQLISEVLRPTNVEIVWAKDGQEAVDLVEMHMNSLNLVLMDIRLPGIDGYECTRIIKQRIPNLPVIAQTAYAMSGEEELCREAGCDNYIRKPLQIRKLVETLNPYLK